MAALMVLDHLPHVPGLVPVMWADIFHVVTRCVAVWFAYGAVEGVLYTSNIRKYLARLWGAAIIMAAGNYALGLLLATRGVHMYDNNPFMAITYALYSRVVWRDLAYLALGAAMFALAWQPYDTWQATVSMLAENSDFMLVLVIPVLHLYNGEHGPHTRFSKYFFYVFYPAHLWLLALVAFVQAG